MNETMVQGHRVTREAVSDFLRRTDDPPPLRHASFYVVRDDGRLIGAKEVIHGVTGGADHSGNEAAQALLRLGFPVRVRRRANGILLRADLHLLFDAGKLGIDPGTLRARATITWVHIPIYRGGSGLDLDLDLD